KQMPCPGDLLAVLDNCDFISCPPELSVELVKTVVVSDDFPLGVTAGYYAGRTPIEHQRDARVRVLVYRITHVAQPPCAASIARAAGPFLARPVPDMHGWAEGAPGGAPPRPLRRL